MVQYQLCPIHRSLTTLYPDESYFDDDYNGFFYHPKPLGIKNILAIRWCAGLGDFIVTLPAFRALKENYPDATLTISCDPSVAGIIEGEEFVDEIVPISHFEYMNLNPQKGNHRLFWRAVENGFYDLIVSFFQKNLVTLSMQPDQQIIYVFVRHYSRNNPSENIMSVLRKYGIDTKNIQPKITLREYDNEYAEVIYLHHIPRPQSKRYIGLCPTSSKEFTRWPVDRFADLANRIHSKYNVQIILFSGMEHEIGAEMVARMKTKPYVVGRMNIKQMAALMKRCSLFISNNTGLMHLAAAVGIPVISIQSSVGRYWGPIGKEHTVVIKQTPCGPCDTLKGLDCKTIECMKIIQVKDVIRAVEKYMK